jgi:hypothetical protein
MNKFEAKNVAAENGWSGYGALTNDEYCVDVPTGELIVRLEIGMNSRSTTVPTTRLPWCWNITSPARHTRQ